MKSTLVVLYNKTDALIYIDSYIYIYMYGWMRVNNDAFRTLSNGKLALSMSRLL